VRRYELILPCHKGGAPTAFVPSAQLEPLRAIITSHLILIESKVASSASALFPGRLSMQRWEHRIERERSQDSLPSPHGGCGVAQDDTATFFPVVLGRSL